MCVCSEAYVRKWQRHTWPGLHTVQGTFECLSSFDPHQAAVRRAGRELPPPLWMSHLGLREVRSLLRVTSPNTCESGGFTLTQSKVIKCAAAPRSLGVEALGKVPPFSQ